MKVILVSGKAQHGKDTFAKLLQGQLKKNGNRVLLTHYADLLKFICRNYFDWDGNKDDKGRAMLQYVGTDVIRKENPSLWVDFVAMMLKYFGENWDYVIIPDCRFPNEIDAMKEHGFDTHHLRVVRRNFVSTLSYEQQQHPSEIALDDVVPDFYIDNSGTLDELNKTVEKWISENLCKGGDDCDVHY